MMEIYRSEEFNPEELALLGRAIGTVGQGTIVVGRDGRAISRYGKRALVVGIVSTGAATMDVRLIPLIALKDFAHKKGLPLVYVYYHNGVRVEVSGFDPDEINAILESRKFISCIRKKIKTFCQIGCIIYTGEKAELTSPSQVDFFSPQIMKTGRKVNTHSCPQFFVVKRIVN